MRYLSLFSGIEAASCAWDELGWEPVAFSEIDPFPCAVLETRYPGVPNLGDVSKVDWDSFKEEYGRIDLLVGGSPCQSFSIAGRREGLDGASGLMWEYVRAVRELLPEWVVWENVPGALSSTHGEDYRCLLASLDELGYGLVWRVLDAQFYGLAQRRRRLFLVGRLGACPPVEVLFEHDGLRWDFEPSQEKRKALTAHAGRGLGCAGFKWHQGSGVNGLGYKIENSPTLCADWHNPAVAIDYKQTPKYSEELCHTLTHEGDGGIHSAVAFCQNTRDEVRLFGGDGQTVGALSAQPGMKQTCFVAYPTDGSGGCLTPWDVQSKRIYSPDGAAQTLPSGTNEGMNIQPCVFTQYGEEIAGTLTARYDSSPCSDRGYNIVTGATDGDVRHTDEVWERRGGQRSIGSDRG